MSSSRAQSGWASAVSTSAIVCGALALTATCAATVGYARDANARGWTSRAFAGASTRARGERGREEIIRSIAFEDDGVDVRVPWSERERAAEDVDGEVAWYRAVARLGSSIDVASSAADARRVAALGARHRRWRGFDGDEDDGDDESFALSSGVVDFALPAYDAREAHARELAAAGIVAKTTKPPASSLGDAEENDATTHGVVQGITKASDEATQSAISTMSPEEFKALSSSAPTATSETNDAPSAFPSVVPLPKPTPTPKPASGSVWAGVMSPGDASTTATAAGVQFASDDEITAALSSSFVSYKKKVDTTNDVNMYERAEFGSGDGRAKSTAQMGWKPADARVLTEENIKANENVEQETLSVSFLSRFPVHLPKSARETQAWKPFEMSDLKSARVKEDTVERVTEAAVALVREQQQQATSGSFAPGNRSRFPDMFSIYFIGPLGALAFFTLFYGVVALVAKKKNESGSNAQAVNSGDDTIDDDKDENAFLNFVRATSIRHSKDKRESAKPGGVAASFMAMLRTDKNADENEALLSTSNPQSNTHRSNTPATAPASAATSGRNTPVVDGDEKVLDGMLVNRTLSAIRTREWTPPASPSRPEEDASRSGGSTNDAVMAAQMPTSSSAGPSAKKQALEVKASDTKMVSVDDADADADADFNDDDDSSSRRMVTATRQPPPSSVSSPPRPVKAVPVPTHTQSTAPTARRQLEHRAEAPSTGAGRRARGDHPPTIVRSMTTKFY